MKRILSLILSLVLTLSMLPAQALAAEALASENPAETVEEPSQPTVPEDSSEPTAPEDSSEPTSPEDSSEPTSPEDSSEPTAPEASSEPTAPEDSSEPTSPEDSSEPEEPSQPELTVVVTAEDNLTELAVGDRLPLTAHVSPAEENAVVVWTSSDEAVATVDQKGLVTGVATGEVTITARVGDAQGSYALTVTRPQASFLSDSNVISSGSCGAEGDNLTFTLTQDGVLTITGAGDMASSAPWSAGRSQITSVVLEEGVTSIGYKAFYGCSSLTSISLPDSLTSIGNYAFDGCSSLTSISLPDSVTSIGEWAFSDCSSLTSISIPEGVTSIGNGAFQFCSRLTSITIPEGVTSIGKRTFNGCSSLTSISLPDSVTSIGDDAFCNCKNLTSISLPDSLTSIGNYAFSGCSLTSISIPEGVTSIGGYAFYNCSSLTSISLPDSVTSIGSYAFHNCSSLTSISIPEGVTSIGNGTFQYCSSLTSISLPDSVTSIGNYAFDGCSRLTSIPLPDSVTSIGDYAFNGCSRLTSISIPEGVTSIGNYAFSGCSLTSISIPEGVTSIGKYAFQFCSRLTSISLPDSVTSIGNYAFSYCISLTIISLPDSLTSIGKRTFYGCSSLTGVIIPGNVTSIGNDAFCDCDSLTTIHFLGDGFLASGTICNKYVTACYPRGNTTWTQEIRDSFGSYITWVECCLDHTVVTDPAKEPTCTETGLTEGSHCSVCGAILVEQTVLPAKGHTVVIDEAVEATCTETGLTEGSHCSVCGAILVEQTVLSAKGHTVVIDEAVEATCTETGLTEGSHCSVCGAILVEQTVLPAKGHTVVADPGKEPTCTETGLTEGSHCSVCGAILVEQTVLPAKGHTVVIDEAVEATCTETGLTEGSHCDLCQQILVPQEVIPMAHRFVDHVCQFCGLCGGTCGENLAWTLTEGRLVISGTGDMESVAEGEAPWYDLRDRITTVELLPGVTSVGDYAFAGCAQLTQVVLPEGLTTIGSHAFQDCTALKELHFPVSVTVIDSQILTGSGVTELYFYGDVPQIAEDAFAGITVSVSYPKDNPTWTQEAMGDYGGTVVWTQADPRTFTLELRQDYLALSPGESAQLSLRTDIPISSEAYTWAVEEGKGVVSVDSQGLVTALAQGSAYVTVSTAIDGVSYSARCRVDVTREPVAQALQGVKLGASAVTAELYRTDYASFDVILLLAQNAGVASVNQAPQDCGAAIESARFADAAMDQLFHLVVKDDRTLLVVPTEDAIQNPTLVKGSYTGKVTVTIDGRAFTTNTALKLTVKKSTPKLKASALTFNAFYTRQSKPIVITGATVTGITAGADTAKTPAIPDWLILEDGALTLSPDAPAKSGSGTVKLLVQTQEWAIPASVSLSVKRTYTAPGLKLSAATVTIPAYSNSDDNGFLGGEAAVRLLCKNKKDTLEGLNVSWIEVPQGWLQLSGENLHQNDGWFPVRPDRGVTPVAGKIILKVHFSDTDRVVELPLTIKTQHTPLAIHPYFPSTSYKLNSTVQDGFFVPWYVGPQYIDLSGYELTWRILDKSGNNVLEWDMFNTWILEDGRLGVWTKPGVVEPGTYWLYMDLQDKQTKERKTEESAVITFTVLPEREKPIIPIKVNNTIDLAFPDPSASITFVKKNYFLMNFENYNNMVPTFTNARGQDVTDQFTFERDNSIGMWVIRPRGEVAVGSYKLDFDIIVDSSSPNGTVHCSAKFTVKRTPIKLKLSKTSLSLNKNIDDWASVDVTCLTKGYDLVRPEISLMDSTGKVSAEGQLTLDYNGGKLTVATNEKTRYGATYKVLLRATKKDSPVTLTVKIPSLYQSTLSATLKAKGTIDVIRDGTSLTLTPSYKNYAGETALEKELKIYSSTDRKTYTTDATHLFRITPNPNGTYTIAKAPGVNLDTALKYRAVLRFPGVSDSKEAYVSLPVKSGAAKLTVTGTPVLYRSDRLSRGTFTITAADKTLSPIAYVTFKDAKHANLFELYDYGNGQYAIAFRDVDSSKYPTSVSLNVWLAGNGSAKFNTTVTVKLKIQ